MVLEEFILRRKLDDEQKIDLFELCGAVGFDIAELGSVGGGLDRAHHSRASIRLVTARRMRKFISTVTMMKLASMTTAVFRALNWD